MYHYNPYVNQLKIRNLVHNAIKVDGTPYGIHPKTSTYIIWRCNLSKTTIILLLYKFYVYYGETTVPYLLLD